MYISTVFLHGIKGIKSLKNEQNQISKQNKLYFIKQEAKYSSL